ncbi:MAG: hypothetical protein C0423_09110 [Methylibium sp.]|nr:hypothetical protein [Methylibium sp.]
MLIFLLLLLPVQWTWAAAASICRHESSIHASHFGHHEHRHDHQASATASVDASDDTPQQGDSGVHADCATCHAAVPWLMMQSAVGLGELLSPLAFTPYQRSVTAGVPERLIRPPHLRLA